MQGSYRQRLIGVCLDLASPTRGRIVAASKCSLSAGRMARKACNYDNYTIIDNLLWKSAEWACRLFVRSMLKVSLVGCDCQVLVVDGDDLQMCWKDDQCIWSLIVSSVHA